MTEVCYLLGLHPDALPDPQPRFTTFSTGTRCTSGGRCCASPHRNYTTLGTSLSTARSLSGTGLTVLPPVTQTKRVDDQSENVDLYRVTRGASRAFLYRVRTRYEDRKAGRPRSGGRPPIRCGGQSILQLAHEVRILCAGYRAIHLIACIGITRKETLRTETGKGYSQRWMLGTSYSTTKRSFANTGGERWVGIDSSVKSVSCSRSLT